MSAARQISRRFGRTTGARARSAADYSITATISVVPDPLKAPYYNSTFPERSFVYVGMAQLSADGREGYVNSDPDYWTSWRVIPMSYYKGELISEESADEGYMEDADGNCVDLDSSDLVRFTRFVAPQNVLITCKPSPVIRDEVTYGQAVWSAMDEILSGEGTTSKIRDILWRQ